MRLGQLDFTALATDTEGCLPVDLRDLVNQALQSAVAAQQTVNEVRSALILRPINADPHSDLQDILLDMDTFSRTLTKFTPLSLRDVKLQKSNVAWSDIGGLHEVRKVLRETLEFPTKYAAIFANCPLRLRSGYVLLKEARPMWHS